MNTNISFALLNRAPRLGARLGVPVDGCNVYVSTVLFGGQRFTRVEADECDTLHYEGDIDTNEAARRYMDGAPCIVAA